MATTSITPDQSSSLSLFHGPTDIPLLTLTLADFLDEICQRHGDREVIITPGNGARWTYFELQRQSLSLAAYLHARGIRRGDRVGILAGNCVEYASIFFACMRLGAILVVLNNTYTPREAYYALGYTECKILFMNARIGRLDNTPMLKSLQEAGKDLPTLQEIILIEDQHETLLEYKEIVNIGSRIPLGEVLKAQAELDCFDTCNLQFTSGSTGTPKTAMLTHHGLLNNARFIGDRMNLGPEDVLCCPPPLFHCFGLVLGLLACITHGSKVVYPSEIFDAAATLRAITDEKCTALHGVPAMFDTLFSLRRPVDFDCSRLRTGIIAGAPVPRYLMELLVHEFGMTEFTSSYGLTEASPTCFNAFVDDTIERRLTSVGTVMPHASAKVIDRHGCTLPVGQRGELCIAGYQLQRGYWRNPEKTAETLRKDDYGTVWLHTGDEALIDESGYCTITGRFKDIIIRGGENVYPLEIEERLVQHPAIDRAIVFGLPDHKYGEQVAAFLHVARGRAKPSLEDLQAWTRQTLGRHKAPVQIFWLGENGVEDIPITGSGKIKKFELRDIAMGLIRQSLSKL